MRAKTEKQQLEITAAPSKKIAVAHFKVKVAHTEAPNSERNLFLNSMPFNHLLILKNLNIALKKSAIV